MSVEALKYSSVPDSLAIWSFQEGLCSETSNRSRQIAQWVFTERKCSEPLCTFKAAFSFRKEDKMDQLLRCAAAYHKLLDITYKIILGRKGQRSELQIIFEPVSFHHLIGLHKLTDLRIARANREKVFLDILNGKITYNFISQSKYFQLIERRFLPFSSLESLLDQNRLVFRYNMKSNRFSLIEADYLLSTPFIENDVYIFLAKHEDTEQYFCRSFFPKEQKDYTKGQAVCTMLYKEKICLSKGTVQIQYDRLTSKET